MLCSRLTGTLRCTLSRAQPYREHSWMHEREGLPPPPECQPRHPGTLSAHGMLHVWVIKSAPVQSSHGTCSTRTHAPTIRSVRRHCCGLQDASACDVDARDAHCVEVCDGGGRSTAPLQHEQANAFAPGRVGLLAERFARLPAVRATPRRPLCRQISGPGPYGKVTCAELPTTPSSTNP